MGEMSFLVVFTALAAALFALAYLTKRRFGIVGLALAAGAMLSALWTGSLTPLIVGAGIEITKPPLQSLVAAVVTVAPACVLLFSGPTYKARLQRILGAAAFAVLTVALLLEPLGSALVIEGPGTAVYTFFTQYHSYVITACLGYAFFDVVFSRSSKHEKH
jgi:hypothetical protein